MVRSREGKLGEKNAEDFERKIHGPADIVQWLRGVGPGDVRKSLC